MIWFVFRCKICICTSEREYEYSIIKKNIMITFMCSLLCKLSTDYLISQSLMKVFNKTKCKVWTLAWAKLCSRTGQEKLAASSRKGLWTPETSGWTSGTSVLSHQRSHCHIPGCMGRGVARRFGEGSRSAVWDLCIVPSLQLLHTGQTLTYQKDFQGRHQIGWGLEHRKSDTRLRDLGLFILGRNSLVGVYTYLVGWHREDRVRLCSILHSGSIKKKVTQEIQSEAGCIHLAGFSFFSNIPVPQPVHTLHIHMSLGPVIVAQPGLAPWSTGQDTQACSWCIQSAWAVSPCALWLHLNTALDTCECLSLPK